MAVGNAGGNAQTAKQEAARHIAARARAANGPRDERAVEPIKPEGQPLVLRRKITTTRRQHKERRDCPRRPRASFGVRMSAIRSLPPCRGRARGAPVLGTNRHQCCLALAPGSTTSRAVPARRHMPNGDEHDLDHRRPPTTRRDRLAALLIVLLIASWLWLLWLIH